MKYEPKIEKTKDGFLTSVVQVEGKKTKPVASYKPRYYETKKQAQEKTKKFITKLERKDARASQQTEH